ncbi:hypothetical protein N7463_004725 [Penicillium fimorum]|uniref:Uncharacterized protein n=1 Tax=Penicillium fimorum TaxID=1882269 RepID=A0A9W9Y3P6_9EURO|nr:hypothetical protein N7463_004725 [Penicillium fimorum]
MTTTVFRTPTEGSSKIHTAGYLITRSFKNGEMTRTTVLWIRGDPGKGETMQCCYLRINNATAVLHGLIYSLVEKQLPLSHMYRDSMIQREKRCSSVRDSTEGWYSLADAAGADDDGVPGSSSSSSSRTYASPLLFCTLPVSSIELIRSLLLLTIEDDVDARLGALRLGGLKCVTAGA